ncbi:uncharacterized protein LOC143897647 [Temnothorax americanus]|uniref:uncharacterized protein LOC143897647 n=1 Tax=Temnothorax americanus TaxID=1964332 RepID=UPI0040678454
MGHIISAEGVALDESKVTAIKELQTPKCKEDVQRVLGMLTYLSGFADDTFLGVEGENWGVPIALSNVAVRQVVAAIEGVGHEVAPQKTQVFFFYDKKKSGELPPPAHITVNGTRVSVEAQMKVLGLWLDGPYLGGASDHARRLYAATVHAVALYGAPVWASAAERLRPIQARLRRVQRIVALRVSRAYCTVSHAEWLDSRRHGLSFHAVQVLTGHGCFGEYLCCIGKEITTRCHHCDEERNTAQHTLEDCPAWEVCPQGGSR